MLAAVGGYFVVVASSVVLDRLGESALIWRANGHRRLAGLVFALTKERWVWIAPVVAVLAIYFSVVFQPGRAETGPVMYALF